MANATASIVGVATLILIILPGLALNFMFLFMYGRRYRLQIPCMYLLVSLSVVNMIAIFFWVISTLMAQFDFNVHLTATPYCTFQALLLIYFQLHHVHTYAIISIERVLKFWKPTLHTEVFYNDAVIIILLVFLWLIELVPALFHVMGWGSATYMVEQFQCAYDDTVAPSRLNAMLTYNYIVPFLFTFICFCCVFAKYQELKNKIGILPGYEDDGKVIEEDLTALGKNNKNVRGSDPFGGGRKTFGNESDSDEDDAYNDIFCIYPEDITDKESLRTRQRIYKYRQRELDFTVTILLIWLLFIVLWLCHLVVQYMKTYTPLQALPLGFETAAAFLAQFSCVIGPIIYWAHNRRFRRHVRFACRCEERPKEPKPQKIHPKPQPMYGDPQYGRGVTGPQQKNIHGTNLSKAEGLDW